jgi:superfamily II DNA or RNA helicase
VLPKNATLLYDYQQKDIATILLILKVNPTKKKLLYQLPTGGGKTMIFRDC